MIMDKQNEFLNKRVVSMQSRVFGKGTASVVLLRANRYWVLASGDEVANASGAGS
jgi:hypothetical protein